ncbi:MAG: hypothetical protein LUH10_15195 [Tannerellaceae bacterium]|nr:hypothetical protein [Tannerellaceae bacterium]
MKQNRLLYIVIGCLFVLSGCKTSRKSVQKYSGVFRDSLYRESGDSLDYAFSQGLELNKDLFIQHIRYSAPDSLSRQFICSVTRIEERIHNKEEAKASLIYQNSKSEQVQYSKEETIAVSGQTQTSSAGYRSCIFLFILLIFITIIKIRKLWQ